MIKLYTISNHNRYFFSFIVTTNWPDLWRILQIMRKGSIHMTNEKVHYKMYKDGRTWVFAAITVATLGLGIVTGTGVTAHADNTDTGVTATGATDTTSGTTATLGTNTGSQDTSATNGADASGTTDQDSSATNVDTGDSTDPSATQTDAPVEPATTAVPTSAPVAAPQTTDAQTATKYLANAQSQPAIVDQGSTNATKSTDGAVATANGSNGVTVGATGLPKTVTAMSRKALARVATTNPIRQSHHQRKIFNRTLRLATPVIPISRPVEFICLHHMLTTHRISQTAITTHILKLT